MNLILASASPRRQELLHRILPDFDIQPAQLDESFADRLPAHTRPVVLAKAKALQVAAEHPHRLVLGCDTGVILGDQMLGKPADRDQARRMLQALSGRTHQVITGCCLAQDRLAWCFSTATSVTFYPLSAQEIEDYLDTEEPYDKAGSYGIQGTAGRFVKEIRGDYYNVVGLPLGALARCFVRIGLK